MHLTSCVYATVNCTKAPTIIAKNNVQTFCKDVSLSPIIFTINMHDWTFCLDISFSAVIFTMNVLLLYIMIQTGIP